MKKLLISLLVLGLGLTGISIQTMPPKSKKRTFCSTQNKCASCAIPITENIEQRCGHIFCIDCNNLNRSGSNSTRLCGECFAATMPDLTAADPISPMEMEDEQKEDVTYTSQATSKKSRGASPCDAVPAVCGDASGYSQSTARAAAPQKPVKASASYQQLPEDLDGVITQYCDPIEACKLGIALSRDGKNIRNKALLDEMISFFDIEYVLSVPLDTNPAPQANSLRRLLENQDRFLGEKTPIEYFLSRGAVIDVRAVSAALSAQNFRVFSNLVITARQKGTDLLNLFKQNYFFGNNGLYHTGQYFRMNGVLFVLNQLTPADGQSLILHDPEILHSAANTSLEFINLILQYVPEEQRSNFIQTQNEEDGTTSLDFAADNHCAGSIDRLLAYIPAAVKRAFITHQDNHAKTALHWGTENASMYASADWINALCNALPEEARYEFLEIADEDNKTALHYAALSRNVEWAKAILAHVPEAEKFNFINLQDNNDETALHIATHNEDIAMAQAILHSLPIELKTGVILTQNRDDETALDIAIANEYEDIENIFNGYLIAEELLATI